MKRMFCLILLALLLAACGQAAEPAAPRPLPGGVDGALTAGPQLVKFTADW